MKMKSSLIVIAVLIFGFVPAPTYADDSLNVQLCAAVFPCDLDGNVLPEFATGSCAETYQQECKQIAPLSLSVSSVRRQIVQCRISNRNLKVSVHQKDHLLAYYKMKVAQLKAQLAQLKK